MNGKLKLPLRPGKYFTVFGGPYKERPANMRGVKMAAEIKLAFDVSIPTEDYSVPDKGALMVGLEEAVDLILSGQPVYVGCMGGMGRTGLFLAVLAKAFRVKSPVPYVRRKYYSHAVETDKQYSFVTKYKIPLAVRRKIKIARIKSYLNPFHWFEADLTRWNGDETPSFLMPVPTLSSALAHQAVGRAVRPAVPETVFTSKHPVPGLRITEVPESEVPDSASK